MLRPITSVASATAFSRVLGLVRDVLLAAILGATPASSAFLLAFTVPNLFRRLFGEGALSAALVPVLAGEQRDRGAASAFGVLNRVLTRFGLVLGLILVVGIGLLALVPLIPGLSERWQLVAVLSQILLPYALLVCGAALISAALNVTRHFSLAAFAQLILNLALIAALALPEVLAPELTDRAKVAWLCLGVLIGGLLHLLVVGLGLVGQGWRPRFDARADAGFREVQRLFLPGVLGAAVYQLNVAVGQLLAFFVATSGVAWLYFANRLVQLPLGVFAIAITTVIFPKLSEETNDDEAFDRTLGDGLRLILIITLPAALGLFFLAEPIVQLCFGWGAFAASDVGWTADILRILAIGLPSSAFLIALTRALHAERNMVAPVRWATVSLVINLVLGLALVLPLGVPGIAIASVVANLIQTLGLGRALGRQRGWAWLHNALNCWSTLIANAWIGFLLFRTRGWVPSILPDPWNVLINIFAVMVIYVIVLRIFDFGFPIRRYHD